MPDFLFHQTKVLDLGSQGAGGDAEEMVRAALNNTYRNILSVTGQEHRSREFMFNITAPARATVTGSESENFTITASSNDIIKIQIDNGIDQTITLTAGTRTAAQVVDDINDNSKYVNAEVSSGSIKLTSNTYGVQSEINIKTVSNHSYTVLGFTVTATTGTNSSQYGMPLYVKYDVNFEDPETGLPLKLMTKSEYDRKYPGVSQNTGEPKRYYHVGKFGVQTQPASQAGTVGVVSSSASDSQSTYVTVIGFLDGLLVRDKVTMTGTTKANTTQTYDTLERIVKTSNGGVSWVGNVTVTDSNSNTIALIPHWVQSPDYLWVEFYPITDTSRQYVLRAQAFKPDMVNDDDWPEFDVDFHYLLDWGAFAQIGGVFGKPDEMLKYSGMYNNGLKSYQSLVDPQPQLVQTFEDVQMGVGSLPKHPWISGVHHGLAGGQ